MIEWLEKKGAAGQDDSFTNHGLRIRVSPSGKGFTVNKILADKLGEYCLVGYDTESKSLVIKTTSAVDYNGKKLWPLKKGNSTIRVNPLFEAFLNEKKLVNRVIELEWKEVGKYFEEIKPVATPKEIEDVVNPKHYNVKALDLYCKGMNIDPKNLTEEQLKQFEIK